MPVSAHISHTHAADEIQDKKITIVHADALALNNVYPDRFRKDIERRWKARGIELIFNDRIDQLPSNLTGTVTTTKGKSIVSDLFVSLWLDISVVRILNLLQGAYKGRAPQHGIPKQPWPQCSR